MESKLCFGRVCKIFLWFALFVTFFNNISAYAQNDFYKRDRISEIRINFYEKNWKTILDSLFSNSNADVRILADIEIDGNTYYKCGVRYKGFSSWNANETKNPFNVSLKYIYKNQNHQGYNSLRLSNVIYDPSFLREFLSYYIIRQYMPASQANFAEVYVNDTLLGLYTSVEAVNEEFIEKYFGNNKNAFFKGSPTQLSFPFGQNANLNYIDNDTASYYPFYKMESKSGWTKLLKFIHTLSNDTAQLDKVLNIDQTLWMHALNYTLLNLDSYIAYSQNYYLYEDDFERFNPIVWDLNMSFGGFRLSDGSYNYQGITIAKLKTLSPLQHLNFSISPRPLLKNLFLNSRYKKMYLAHIRTILEQNILNNHYLEVAEEVHNFIEPYVLKDTNKFYSYEDFKNNLYTTTGSGGSQIAGIKDLMESRANFLFNFEGVAGTPNILSEQFLPQNPKLNSSVNFNLETENAKKVFLYYRTKPNHPFNCIEMFDNGLNGDDIANNGVFSVSVQLKSKTYQYYYWAENDVAGEFLPKEAANKFFSLNVQAESGDIVINEVYFSDNNVWIEIFNNTSNEFCLDGMYISQNSNFNYYFPDTILSPFSFFVIEDNYLDSELKEDVLFLYNNNKLIIDSMIVVNTQSEKSIGRYPNGKGDFCFTKPTIGFSNILKNYANISFELYPNPTEDYVNIEILPKYKIQKIIILDYFGRIMYSNIVNNNEIFLFKVDVSTWSRGVYLVYLICEDKNMSKKLILR